MTRYQPRHCGDKEPVDVVYDVLLWIAVIGIMAALIYAVVFVTVIA